jgi:hypothetical protein
MVPVPSFAWQFRPIQLPNDPPVVLLFVADVRYPTASARWPPA